MFGTAVIFSGYAGCLYLSWERHQEAGELRGWGSVDAATAHGEVYSGPGYGGWFGGPTIPG